MLILQVNDKGLKRAIAGLTKSKKLFQSATAAVINDMAFSTRNETIDSLHRHTTTRSKGFAAQITRYTMASPSAPIHSQSSFAGFIERGNFSGFVEQELGKSVEKKTTATLASRDGNRMKSVKRSYRLNRQMEMLNSKKRNTAIAFLKTKRGNKPFVVKNQPNIKDGVYTNKNGKLSMVQSFTKMKQPKRFSYLTEAYNNMRRNNSMDMIWRRQIDRILRLK